MGSISSKQALEQCTAQEIAYLVREMGDKYMQYTDRIQKNQVSGALLASLNESTIAETLDRLEVTERLHRRKFERVLTKIECSLPEMESLGRTEDSSSSSLSSSSRVQSQRPSGVEIETVIECALAASELDERMPEANGMLLPAMLDAILTAQQLERKSLQQNVMALETQRTLDSPPEDGPVAIVLTDIEGSTYLWETNPEAMKEALSLHDSLIRKLRETNHGYEIDTEGDAFFLAFSDASDAFAFALQLQVALYETQWSDEILSTEWGRDDGERRGLRVRVSIHMGQVETMKNPVTRRTEYYGPAMDVAEELERLTRGGQILTTADTWNAAFYLADAKLGSPDVSEFHKPLVLTDKDMDGSVQSRSQKRVLELTPRSLKRLTTSTVKLNAARREHFARLRSKRVKDLRFVPDTELPHVNYSTMVRV